MTWEREAQGEWDRREAASERYFALYDPAYYRYINEGNSACDAAILARDWAEARVNEEGR